MGFDLGAIDDLMSSLDKVGDIGDKIQKDALKKAGKIMLKSQEKFAPKDSGDGASVLSISNIKKYRRSKDPYIKIGIDKKNWDKGKGIWFQNFNGIHSSGEHLGWMKKAYENAKEECAEVMSKEILKELEKILGD